MTTKRNISITTGFDYGMPVEKQIPLIAQAGFNYVTPGADLAHFDFLSKSAREKFAGLLRQYSLKIDTLHAPFASGFNIGLFKETAGAAVEFGVRVVVLHCSPFEISKADLAVMLPQLKKDCGELDKFAGDLGIVYALENQAPGPAAELIKRTLQECDYKNIGFCYDSSHDQIDGPRSFELLEELKDKLVAVHLSDRIKPFTDHVPPWEGFIHWDELCRILKTVKITFPLQFEVMTAYSAEKDPEKFLKLAYERACRVWDMIFR